MNRFLTSVLVGVALMCATPAAVAAPPGVKQKAGTDPAMTQQRAADPKGETPSLNNYAVAMPQTSLRRALSPKAIRAAEALRATGPQRAIAHTIDLIGQVRYSPTLTQNNYYHIPHTTGGDFTELGNTYYNLNFGSYYDAPTNTVTGVASQILFGEPTFIYILTYDATTLEELSRIETDVNMMALGADRDEATGQVYGYYYNGDIAHAVWGTADYTTAVRTAIKDVAIADVCQAVVAGTDGYHYGIRAADGKLVRIDRATGTQTAVGQTAVPVTYTPASCLNPRNNTMLVMAVADDQNTTSLYEVDLTSGATTICATYPMAQFTQMYIAAALADDKAPLAPTLTLAAPDGTMTVDLTLTLPTQLMDLTPTSGNMDWTIEVNGQQRFSGTDAAGSSIARQVTMTEAGPVTFTARATNAAGPSPQTVAEIFVGHGVPAAPQNVTLSWSDGTMTLTWDDVTTSADGGYIDPAQVRYDVTLGGVTLMSDMAATSHSWQVAEPYSRTPYVCSVTARYDGRTSNAATSNTVNLGPFPVPFHTLFNSTEIFDEYNYTVLDANGDGRTWTAQPAGARYYYSQSLAADDWLFSPQIRLEGGKAYKLDIDVASDNSTYTERVEVKAGKTTTAKGMTMTVIEPTEVPAVLREGTMRLTGMVIPDEDGIYHLGIHAVSDKDRYLLWVTELNLAEGMNTAAPAAPTTFTLTPDATGANTLNGSLHLPSLSVSGTPLSGTVRVTVTCGDRTVATLQGAPGATVTFNDTLAEAGTYTYTATPSCDNIEGVSVEATAYVGPYAPAAPQSAAVVETTTRGTVKVTWDAVTKDIHNTTLPASQITYQIYATNADGTLTPILQAPTSQLEATFQAVADATDQEFVQYAVYAFNRGLRGEESATTELIAVGQPYAIPVHITNDTDLDTYIVGINPAGGATIGLGYASDLSVPACDDDVTFYCYSYYYGRSAEIFTGKIDLRAAVNPEFSFYTWRHANDDEDIIEIYALHDGQRTLLRNMNHIFMNAGEWNKVRVDLSAYAGSEIQILLAPSIKSYSYVLFDDLRIQEVPDRDVAAVAINAPVNVTANTEFTVSGKVSNFGRLAADGITVTLNRDGEPVATSSIASLASGATQPVEFVTSLSYFDTQADYSISVLMNGDEDATNDTSRTATVLRPASTLEGVTDLQAQRVDEGVKLTWSTYSTAGRTPQPRTDDFEDGESYADHYGDWHFVDRDQAPIGLVVPVPGYGSGTSAASFIVFDNDNDAYSASNFSMASGHKCLMAFYNFDWSDNDDWAISPLLCGDAQHISFWAKSFRNDYRESFEVLYTTEDNYVLNNYTLLDTQEYIPGNEWTKYEYDLPQGALHFAIHYISSNAYMLMVDDVTYTPDIISGLLTLTGYDIYRDGEKINTTPVTTGEYIDTEANTGLHTYHVVAHYTQGASELSNGATIDLNVGVNATLAGNVKIGTTDGHICVSGAAEVTIFAADGKVIYRGHGDCCVAAAPGIYTVAADRITRKVVVR